MTYVALVLGSTGAVGRDLVAELVESTSCSKVIALTRREIPVAAWGEAFPSMDVEAAQSKLEIVPVDFDELHGDWKKAIADVDAAFSCMGTTRKDAGSAEAFRKGWLGCCRKAELIWGKLACLSDNAAVDLEYVTTFAELAKDSHVPYFGLLTASNANKDSWFLYPQTKGEVEENIKGLEFERTSIFRPGLIDRGELSRTLESVALYVVPSITTRAIAKGMVVDYESGAKGLKEWSNTDLKQLEMEQLATPNGQQGEL
ncbi:hypothetical protein BBJ28_00019188 [Nothophytophthora sp. Chile5]|nr:hypothetical protein BBJ28_00019188 [Nothophytophthora sp. Chile5]